MPFTYFISQVHRLLRETLTAPPIPQVALARTHYVVQVNGTVHHVRRDGVCTCSGTPQQLCAATPLVQAYLANGGQRPPGRDESTWPETWTNIPSQCPVCDCPTIPDRYLNSRAGPGWKCSLTHHEHFWMARMNPLRRYLAANPPQPCYPWYDTSEEERRAWLEAHYLPPRLVPSEEGGNQHALDRAPPSQSQAGARTEICGLAALRVQGRPVRSYERLL